MYLTSSLTGGCDYRYYYDRIPSYVGGAKLPVVERRRSRARATGTDEPREREREGRSIWSDRREQKGWNLPNPKQTRAPSCYLSDQTFVFTTRLIKRLPSLYCVRDEVPRQLP